MPRFIAKRIDGRVNSYEPFYVKYRADEYVNMGASPVIYEQPCFFDVLAYLWPGDTRLDLSNDVHPGLNSNLRFFAGHPQNSPTQRVWTWGANSSVAEQILVIKQ